MRRFNRVVRPVLPRRTIVGLFAASFSIALLPCGVALADTVTSDFESASGYHVGSIAGQNSWRSGNPGSPTGEFDQGVIGNGGTIHGFGQQSFRISNLYASTAFYNQTYSAPVNDPAGETQTNTEYVAQFSFTTTTPAFQNGLYMSVSPDNGLGGRMSWVSLRDTQDGIAVSVADAPTIDGDFTYTPVALLARGVPHTIKFWIKFNSGPNNDLVRISIDGKDTGQCFATWENYYRAGPESDTGPLPSGIDRLEFRASVPAPGLAAGGGYLFDNVSVTTSNGAGPPGCDVPIAKQADSPTVTAGSIAGYRLSVRNRGRLTARNYRVCDHIPRQTTFVSADRRLRRIGRARCFVISRLDPGQRASVHLMLRVNVNATPGNLDNTADITPVPPPTVPAVPPALNVDLPSGAATAPISPITKVKAILRILRAKRAVQPPGPPRVTG